MEYFVLQECPLDYVMGGAFQQKLDKVFSGLQGVIGIADDMFICSRTVEEHDQNLTNFLNSTSWHGLKTGESKIQYKKTSVEFYGLQFVTNGHKPTDNKFHDIQLMPEPKDIKPATIIS